MTDESARGAPDLAGGDIGLASSQSCEGSGMLWGSTAFRPGDHVGLVAQHTVALIAQGHEGTRAELWEMVRADVDLDEVLDRLSATGIRSLPDFGLVQVRGADLLVVVRGAAVACLTDAEGETSMVEATDVRTWVESRANGVVAAEIWIGDSAPITDFAGDAGFLVVAGLVPADWVRRDFASADDLAAATRSGSGGDAIAQCSEVVDSVDGVHGPASAEHADDETDVEMADDGMFDVEVPPLDADVDSDPAPDSADVADVAVVDDGPPVAELSPSVGLLPETPPAPVPAPSVTDPTMRPVEENHTLKDASTAYVESPSPSDGAAPQEASIQPAQASVRADHDGYDFMYGDTVARSVENAAVRVDDEMIGGVPDAGELTGEAPGVELVGDHDGLTVSRKDLAEMREPVAPPPVDGPVVLATMCDLNHPNPPEALRCRVCGRQIGTAAPITVARPPLGLLVFSNGERIVVDRNVLIGRNPKVSGTVVGELPHLARFQDDGHGLSRTHAEIRVEGWQMLLEDLRSVNGTEITMPGQTARRLRPHEPVALVAGAVIEFGDQLRCSVETVG